MSSGCSVWEALRASPLWGKGLSEMTFGIPSGSETPVLCSGAHPGRQMVVLSWGWQLLFMKVQVTAYRESCVCLEATRKQDGVNQG